MPGVVPWAPCDGAASGHSERCREQKREAKKEDRMDTARLEPAKKDILKRASYKASGVVGHPRRGRRAATLLGPPRQHCC